MLPLSLLLFLTLKQGLDFFFLFFPSPQGCSRIRAQHPASSNCSFCSQVSATWRDAADSNTVAAVSLALSTGSSRKDVLISEEEMCLALHVNGAGSICGMAYGIRERHCFQKEN